MFESVMFCEWTCHFCKHAKSLHTYTSRSKKHTVIRLLNVQPIAFGVSVNLNLHSQCHCSLFNGTWQTRPRELDSRLRFEIQEMTLQMQ